LSRASLARLAAAAAATLVAGTGCWEQWSVTWWPQMKWQKPVQAFEDTEVPGFEQGFTPPEGARPVAAPPPATSLPLAELERMPNPRPATLGSLANGKAQFETFCAPCHGAAGLGDGPVAGPPFGKGPLLGVLPIAGPVGKQITAAFTDGHLYAVIAQGIRRMPSYKRIPEPDRWDIVNYLRYLNGQLPGPPAPAAQAAAAAPPGDAQ
jgi:mono/diheme cytochrome c family protein